MKLHLAISPCPNDTFMFDAIINDRLGINFDLKVTMADIEELNVLASNGVPDICKISYNAYPPLSDQYQLLNAGSALGRNFGPLLIARSQMHNDEWEACTIAIPGRNTTANFLLTYAYPELIQKTEVLFSDIEEKVMVGEYDFGLIIHENRFTYHKKGLVKIQDLGAYWEKKTGYPIPLGGIAIKRTLPEKIKSTFNEALSESIRYAFSHPEASSDFVRCHAQEMDPDVTRLHIDLYVNDYSIDLGPQGKAAVTKLFTEKERLTGIKPASSSIFIK